MTLPDPLLPIVAQAVDRPRKPFKLTAPDDRVFLAPTFEELVRLTAPEFDPRVVVRPKAPGKK